MAPLMPTLETVTLELPEFVSVTGRLLLEPVLMFPKLKVVWLALRRYVAAFTVRVATLLVTLPAELLIATLNCDPLSEVVVDGVAYVAAVAPLIAAPFFCHW